jgi:hypothetical protein
MQRVTCPDEFAAAMKWVRNPWWDGCWLLSGLPIGLALMILLPSRHAFALVVVIMILESGHVVSPMILAWTRPGLRAIVKREWIKHIAAPAAVMGGVLIFPPAWVAGLYWAWNIYHFGMQNFGVSSLYCRRWRRARKWLCLGLTASGMAALPHLSVRAEMLCLGVFSFGHWLTDIGLSSRVARWHWGFVALMLAIGVAWLLARQGPLSVHLVPQIIVIRYGIGMVHFIYSARIWKINDPQVRQTMNRCVQGRPG